MKNSKANYFNIFKIESINNWFENLGRFVVKARWIIIVISLIFIILGITGLLNLKFELSIDSFFLKDDPLMVDKENFERLFGNNDFVGVLIDADDVFSYKILKLIRDLGTELKEEIPFAKELVSLTDFKYTSPKGATMKISDSPVPEDPETIEFLRNTFDKSNSLRGKLYSDDYTQAWIILRLNEYPEHHEWEEKNEPALVVGEKAYNIITRFEAEYKELHPDDKNFKLTPTGIPVHVYRKKIDMNEDLVRVLIVAGIIAVIFIMIMIRTIPGTIGTIVVMGASIVIVFGAMGWLGISTDTTFMLVPMLLTIAVSVGYTIHITNFFKQNFRTTGKRKEAVIYAFKETGWPVLFTAATTIAALLSFLFIPIKPIRWVGLTAAAGIGAVYLISMLFYSSVLSIGKDREPHPEYAETGKGKVEHFFISLSEWVMKHGVLIVIIFTCFMGILIVGVFKVDVDLNTKVMLGDRLPHVRDAIYVGESKVGSMYSYDLTLQFTDENQLKDVEILKKVNQLEDFIRQEPLIKRVSSLVDIIKDYYLSRNDDEPEYYRIPSDFKTVNGIIALYERTARENARTWVNKEYSVLRIFVEVADFSSDLFIEHMKALDNKIKELFPETNYAGFKYSLVGNVLQLSVMNDYVTHGQIISFGIALFVIAVLMITIFGSVKVGLIAMIPNIAPALVASGLIGLLGIPLEFITMTIGPMVLGLAVDNTIHIINHIKLEYNRNHNYDRAIRNTFMSVGNAVTQTSAIICFTFVAFLLSRMDNVDRMGLFTIAAIFAALIADLFVTPTIIRLIKPFIKK